MIEAFRDRFGIDVIQGWGMTETSPWPRCSIPRPVHLRTCKSISRQGRSRRRPCRSTHQRRRRDDPSRDGKTVGEFEIRGPWITASYFGVDAPERFHDGWLRTGDIGSMDAEGFMTISDRSKDVIKSGGEWISSVDLEGALMAHPAVFEAAVIAVPTNDGKNAALLCRAASRRHYERPKNFVSSCPPGSRSGGCPNVGRSSRGVPKTSVGKFDKKGAAREYARTNCPSRRSPSGVLGHLGRRGRRARSRVADAIFDTVRAQLRSPAMTRPMSWSEGSPRFVEVCKRPRCSCAARGRLVPIVDLVDQESQIHVIATVEGEGDRRVIFQRVSQSLGEAGTALVSAASCESLGRRRTLM